MLWQHPARRALRRSAWGVELRETLASKNFGLLYDIYHIQIMEGDIIRTSRENHRWFTHYHTGGCPGRNEIDATQEFFYPAIMRAIAATGYTGFVGQEFVPLAGDPLASLRLTRSAARSAAAGGRWKLCSMRRGASRHEKSSAPHPAKLEPPRARAKLRAVRHYLIPCSFANAVAASLAAASLVGQL